MKKLKVSGVLIVVGLFASCAKGPEGPIGGNDYFPLQKGKVAEFQSAEGASSDLKVTRVYEVTDFRKEGDYYLADYVLTMLADKHNPIKSFNELKVDAKSALSLKHTTEIDGKQYPAAGGRILLMIPRADEKISREYLWHETKMSDVFFRGKAQNAKKLYPDCVVLEERMTYKKDHYHTKYYYQKGMGLVRIEDIKPDGTVDKDSVMELFE